MGSGMTAGTDGRGAAAGRAAAPGARPTTVPAAGAVGAHPAGVTRGLAAALESQLDRLQPCVHCGFCLPACPTYVRLGDEADSPRGRLHLMRAVVEGRLDPASGAFQEHIDRCLGCRACEPVCPSGVEYGTLLEHARETARAAAPPPLLTRALLATLGSRRLRGPFFLVGRLLRGSGLAGRLATAIPARGPLRSLRLALAMLASSAPGPAAHGSGATGSATPTGLAATTSTPSAPSVHTAPRPRVGVLRGCVQEGLFGRVGAATRRVLEANGFEVVEVVGQDCCGALHAHAGALAEARALARRNVAAIEAAEVDHFVVDAAGCGAAMKAYGTILEDDPDWAERGAAVAARVRDVTELLAEVGPRPGAPVPCRVAYDHPCHLLHAQAVREAPLRVLAAVPGVEVRVVEGADECCGGAGIYGLTHPELGGRIGHDKIEAVAATGAELAATPNPGCMMQIGAGLRLRSLSTEVVHPVELLDRSYRRAGYYGGATAEENRRERA